MNNEEQLVYVGTYLNHDGDITIDPNSMAYMEGETETLLLSHLMTDLEMLPYQPLKDLSTEQRKPLLKQAGCNIISIPDAQSDALLETLK